MKPRAKSALVYSLFEKNADSAICKICLKELKFSGNTKNLICHLRRIHPSALRPAGGTQDDRPGDAEGGSNNNKTDSRPPLSKRLPLQKQVAAISLYDRNPMYSIVARHFMCPVVYIKRIIECRDEILEEWNNQTSKVPINEQKIVFVGQASPVELRVLAQCEMRILNNEMDVWIRECMNDPNFEASDELLLSKAFEMMKLYNLKNVVPKESWVSWIRRKYDLKNYEEPPESDTSSSEEDNNPAAEDQDEAIVEQERMSELTFVDPLNRPSTWRVLKGRMAKLELVNDAVYEWVLRMQSQGNGSKLHRCSILQTAQEANKHVKIHDLKPGKHWFRKFKQKYNLTSEDLNSRRLYKDCSERKKHLSLEIPNIVNFVRQKYSKERNHRGLTGRHRLQIAYKKSKDGELIENIVADDKGPGTSQEVVEIVEIVDDDEEGLDDDVPVKHEDVDDIDFAKCAEDVEIIDGVFPMEGAYSPLKIMEIADGVGDVVVKEDIDEEKDEPRQVKRLETHDLKNTKKLIKSDEEALRYLQALENFVLLQANFRAIGVISELEKVFRSPGVNH